MRILQIIPSLGHGGAEKFVCELSNELQSKPDISCDIALMYDIEDASIGFISTLRNVRYCSLHKKPGFSIHYLFKLYRYIRDNKYDVVHAHLNAITYLILSAFLLPKTKFVATIHSDAQFEAPGKIDKLTRKLLFATKRVLPVTISEESNLSFKTYYGMEAPIIYNGVSKFTPTDIKGLFDVPENHLIFIHPASCQPVKNQRMLLSVFRRITTHYENVHFYWFGSNTHNPELFAELSLYLSDRVRYCGCVDNMREYLAEADAMCLSSTIEGMPMVIIEALSVGCIPVVTPAGGCVNMIENGVNGFITSGFDEVEYYDMIDSFINMKAAERHHMRINSIESFRKFSIENSASSYMLIYQS